MKRLILISIYIIFGCDLLTCQIPFPAVNAPSPEAASLGAYGNIPVNLYTGCPEISIPIYEIQEGEINVPIRIDYNLRNVKAAPHTSWIGWGWNLSAGGCITRTVRTIMDEKKGSGKDGIAQGFYAHHEKLKDVTSQEKLIEHSKNVRPQKDGSNDYYELAADEFYFNFCGYTGYFYMNENGGWTVVSDHAIQVIFDEETGFITSDELRIDTNGWSSKYYNNRFFEEFTLVTPDGIRYTFGGKNKNATEYSISYYNRMDDDLIPTSWFLTEINSPTGRKITFNYEAGDNICEIRYSPVKSMYYVTEKNEIVLKHGLINEEHAALSGYLIFPVYLTSIITSYASIEFISETDYYEKKPDTNFLAWTSIEKSYWNLFNPFGVISPSVFTVFFPGLDYTVDQINFPKRTQDMLNWRRLTAISITPTNASFAKTYYFSHRTLQAKKVLESLTEKKGKNNSSGTVSKKYKFSYYDIDKQLPAGIYRGEDHWGYINGESISFINTVSDVVDKREIGELKYNTIGVLKEITYPTGGKTVFEYEKNISKKRSGGRVKGEITGGIRIAKITDYKEDNTIDKIKKYYYTIYAYPVVSDSMKYTSGYSPYSPDYSVGIRLDLNNEVHRSWDGVTPLKGLHLLDIKYSYNLIPSTTNHNIPIVGYASVTEEILDNNEKTTGYIWYQFSEENGDIWGIPHNDDKVIHTNYNIDNNMKKFSSRSMERGKLMSKKYYNTNQKLVKSIKYNYDMIGGNRNSGLKTIHQEVIFHHPGMGKYSIFASMFNTYTYSFLPTYEVETYYDPETEEEQQVIEKIYTYNDNKFLTGEKVIVNDNENYETRTTYLADLNSRYGPELPLNLYIMASKNMISYPIETVKYKNNRVIASDLIEYSSGEKYPFFPSKKLNLETEIPINNYIRVLIDDFKLSVDNRLKTYLTSVVENEYALTNYVRTNDEGVVYLWSYKGMYPVAEIKNVTLQEVKTALKITGDSQYINELAIRSEPLEEDWEKINSLRTGLPHGFVTTYKYKPLIGMVEQTDPRGITTYYDYDSFGRLQEVYYYEEGKSSQKRTVKAYEYNYSNK